MRIRIIVSLFILSIMFAKAAFNSKMVSDYEPVKYSRAEVVYLFDNNKALFYKTVKILIENKKFDKNGRLYEDEDAFIMSDIDKNLKYFDDDEKKVILQFLKFKPYMLSVDNSRDFVKITFLADNSSLSYSFIFWKIESQEDKEAFNEYKSYLKGCAIHYIVEEIEEDCVLYYCVKANNCKR